MGDYEIESVSNPNKKINFFTKKCYQGCNLFSNNGLIIVASDGGKEYTLVDISTTMEQIVGRLRNNDEYQNRFRNHVVHLYTTNNHIESDEEFEQQLHDKEEQAKNLLSLQEKANDEERKAYIKNLRYETSLLSEKDGRLEMNELKKQSFIYKHELRKLYKDGLSLRSGYCKSKKFTIEQKQEYWNEFDVKLAHTVTVTELDLLKDYLDTRDEAYEIEYPYFKDIVRYLKPSEMSGTCKWNIEAMIKMADDRMRMNIVYRNIYHQGFISNKDLKQKFADEFRKQGITLSPKASLIKECKLYEVEKKKTGYIIGKWTNFKFE